MPRSNPSLNLTAAHLDPFAMQLALSTVHARLVPMRRGKQGYELDPSTRGWAELQASRGFAGYGLGRALRMLLDVLRGLTALHDTFDATGETFAHGDVALSQLRIDTEGVCRLVPLTARHSLTAVGEPSRESLGYLAPERLLGEAIDVRADVFSAGALLWEALAGRRLFEETSGDAIIDRLMGEKLLMPQLPPELAWAIPLKAVAARALAVDPHQRFTDCAELATAIAIVARDRVASHAEIASSFGSSQRPAERRLRESVPGARTSEHSALSALIVPSSGPRVPASEGSQAASLPSRRPIPTRSSTFPAAVVPPSSRRSSTLAPHGPERSLTPPPSTSTSAPPPATLLAPESSTRSASRSAGHVSPFSNLLSAESRGPASEPASSGRRVKTMLSPGTPSSVLAADAARSSAAPAPLPTAQPLPFSRTLPGFPPLPANAGIATTPSVAPPLPFSSTVPTAEVTLDEANAFRSGPARRTWLIVGALVLLAAVIGVVLAQGGTAEPAAAKTPAVTAAAPIAPHAASPSDEGATNPTSAPPAATVEPASTHSATAPSAPAASAPTPRAATHKASKTEAKDYGI